MVASNSRSFMETACVFQDDCPRCALGHEPIASRKEARNLRVINTGVAFPEDLAWDDSILVTRRDEDMGPSILRGVCQVDEDLQPFDPVEIKME